MLIRHVWEPMGLAANVGFLGQALDPWNLPEDSLWLFLVNWGQSHCSGPVKAEAPGLVWGSPWMMGHSLSGDNSS